LRLCASESSASEVLALEAGLAEISLEQLAGVFAASRPTLAVAADGSVAGRVSDSQGQRGRAAGTEEREEGRAAEAGADYKKLRRAWCLGAETFRKELFGRMKKQMGAEHYGAEREETLEAHAEGIVL
jgi:hypothetical protein